MSRGEDAAQVLLAGVRNVRGGLGWLAELSMPELERAYHHTLEKVARYAGQLAHNPSGTIRGELDALHIVSGAIVRAIDAANPTAQPPCSEVLHAQALRAHGPLMSDIEPFFDFTGRATQLQLDTRHIAH